MENMINGAECHLDTIVVVDTCPVEIWLCMKRYKQFPVIALVGVVPASGDVISEDRLIQSVVSYAEKSDFAGTLQELANEEGIEIRGVVACSNPGVGVERAVSDVLP